MLSFQKLGEVTNKTLKGILQSKDNKQKDDLKPHQNLIFNELSRFVNFFINFCLPYEQANQLLLTICEEFQLDKSKVNTLSTELLQN